MSRTTAKTNHPTRIVVIVLAMSAPLACCRHANGPASATNAVTTAPTKGGGEAATGNTDPGTIEWTDWNDGLFARAARENKLVLLDLGAVWCHWCHVMDERTYSDPRVIGILRQKYIAVRVDQDARPDLSNRYEDYGWPATVLFDSAGRELAKRQGYIPPDDMAAMLDAFVKDPTPGPSAPPRAKIEYTSASAVGEELRNDLVKRLVDTYDAERGGWGRGQKFVDPLAIEWYMTQAPMPDASEERQKQARQTLTAGIKLIDPVWGGVYQYSTDGDWDHPHFEKIMSYQAGLLRAYAMAGVRFDDPKFVAAANSIHTFLVKFLLDSGGAFYASQDADVIPGQHSGEYFALDDASRRKIGVPAIDRHIYSRENGWAIEALADFYAASADADALAQAQAAARWIMQHRSLPGGGFSHVQRDVAGPYLGDTLSMARAFLALYRVTGDRQWLKASRESADFIIARFSSPEDAAFVSVAISASAEMPPAVITPIPQDRPRPQTDENVSAARFFNLLNHYTHDPRYRQAAERAMRFLSTPAVVHGRGDWLPGALLADAELRTEPLHVTVVGAKNDLKAQSLYRAAIVNSAGYQRIEWYDAKEGPMPNADVEYPGLQQAAAFLCTGNTCSAPINESEVLKRRMAQ